MKRVLREIRSPLWSIFWQVAFVPWVQVLVGTGALALLAQVAFHLPWSPVPVTGQTLGVLLLSFVLGRRAIFSVALYLGLGAAGLPVFSLGSSGLIWGPRFGYLIGMLITTLIVGLLVERGWAKSFPRRVLLGLFGHALILACGVLVLSFFVPFQNLWMSGLIPFLPGDVVKAVLAAGLGFRKS